MKLDTARLTNDEAATVLEAALAAVRSGDTQIDLGAVQHVDSAAVALLLALKREAQARNAALAFINVPSALVSLANLYGVDGLLGCPKAAAVAGYAQHPPH